MSKGPILIYDQEESEMAEFHDEADEARAMFKSQKKDALKYIVINIDQCYKNGTMDTVELQKEINLIADQGYRLVKSDTMFFMVFELIEVGIQIEGPVHPNIPWKRKV